MRCETVWLQVNKEWLQGPSKKINSLWYGPFDTLDKVWDNAYQDNLHTYMCIYSMVNVKILKLYELSMPDCEEEYALPYLEDLAPNS